MAAPGGAQAQPEHEEDLHVHIGTGSQAARPAGGRQPGGAGGPSEGEDVAAHASLRPAAARKQPEKLASTSDLRARLGGRTPPADPPGGGWPSPSGAADGRGSGEASGITDKCKRLVKKTLRSLRSLSFSKPAVKAASTGGQEAWEGAAEAAAEPEAAKHSLEGQLAPACAARGVRRVVSEADVRSRQLERQLSDLEALDELESQLLREPSRELSRLPTVLESMSQIPEVPEPAAAPAAARKLPSSRQSLDDRTSGSSNRSHGSEFAVHRTRSSSEQAAHPPLASMLLHDERPSASSTRSSAHSQCVTFQVHLQEERGSGSSCYSGRLMSDTGLLFANLAAGTEAGAPGKWAGSGLRWGGSSSLASSGQVHLTRCSSGISVDESGTLRRPSLDMLRSGGRPVKRGPRSRGPSLDIQRPAFRQLPHAVGGGRAGAAASSGLRQHAAGAAGMGHLQDVAQMLLAGIGPSPNASQARTYPTPSCQVPPAALPAPLINTPYDAQTTRSLLSSGIQYPSHSAHAQRSFLAMQGPQPGFGPHPGFSPEPGLGPQLGYSSRPGFSPQPGFSHLGYDPAAPVAAGSLSHSSSSHYAGHSAAGPGLACAGAGFGAPQPLPQYAGFGVSPQPLLQYAGGLAGPLYSGLQAQPYPQAGPYGAWGTGCGVPSARPLGSPYNGGFGAGSPQGLPRGSCGVSIGIGTFGGDAFGSTFASSNSNAPLATAAAGSVAPAAECGGPSEVCTLASEGLVASGPAPVITSSPPSSPHGAAA